VRLAPVPKCSGTLGRSLDLGFSPDDVLGLRVSLSGLRYDQPHARVQFWADVVTAVKALPGVEAASVSRGLPIGEWAGQYFTISDQPKPPAGQVPTADYVIAGPDYFRTLWRLVRRRARRSAHWRQLPPLIAKVRWVALPSAASQSDPDLLSYSISQRTREIGVRMALGAGRAGVLWLVMGDGAGLTVLGIQIGIASALALTRLMTYLLFGVGATDPATFGAVALVLAITSLLASYIPARRVMKVDPIEALRYE
jgi:hypothetical protein